MNKQQLIEFEKDIIQHYEKGDIRAPVHLSGGNEEQVIEIFKKIKKNDWVFSTHRSHYHALLKSNNPKWLKKEILNGRSIHINSKKYKIVTSAIVGGIIPIALGTALAIKRSKGKEHVYCFIGDMASEMGVFMECFKYTIRQNLPIKFIVEDNGLSVYTPTKEVWGQNTCGNLFDFMKFYEYERQYPHHGISKWIDFDKKKHKGSEF